VRVEVENRRDIEGTSTWRVLAPEFDRCAQRAAAAGAEGVLRYVGAGATAIVFVDQVGMAYKVARHDDGGDMRQSLRDESEWLDSAASTAIADHVVRMFDYDPARDVIVREYVDGRTGRWSDEGVLQELHDRVRQTMRAASWGAPEFKGDSYVRGENGRWVLIDASFALRYGQRLLDYAVEILDGTRPRGFERDGDLAFAIRHEVGLTIDAAAAAPVLARMAG